MTLYHLPWYDIALLSIRIIWALGEYFFIYKLMIIPQIKHCDFIIQQ